MKIGDAVIMALKEVGRPMTLEEIVDTLIKGFIGSTPEAVTRAVNAALMKTSGINRLDDGRYEFDQEDADIPF